MNAGGQDLSLEPERPLFIKQQPVQNRASMSNSDASHDNYRGPAVGGQNEVLFSP